MPVHGWHLTSDSGAERGGGAGGGEQYTPRLPAFPPSRLPVLADRFTATAGQDAEFTFLLYTGGATGPFLLTKVDFITSQVIPGAGFVLYDPSCQTAVTGEVITDANGQALLTDLAPGNCCIIETIVPPGYQGSLQSATTDFAGRQSTLGLANHPAPTLQPTAPIDPTATNDPTTTPDSTAPRDPTVTLSPTATTGPGPTASAPSPASTATSIVDSVTTLPNTGIGGDSQIVGTSAWLALAGAVVGLVALGGRHLIVRRRA